MICFWSEGIDNQTEDFGKRQPYKTKRRKYYYYGKNCINNYEVGKNLRFKLWTSISHTLNIKICIAQKKKNNETCLNNKFNIKTNLLVAHDRLLLIST